jgi:hypothetical protein
MKRLKEVKLKGRFTPTGKTRHLLGDSLAPIPAKLMIAQETGDPGFLLFYLDEAGDLITETYHETLQKAYEQAQWEFRVPVEAWTDVYDA